MQNTRIVKEFKILRPAWTSPRLKHATQKPTLLWQKISALIGSGIELHLNQRTATRVAQILTAAGGALAVLLLVCALWTRGMRSRAVADQPTAALLT